MNQKSNDIGPSIEAGGATIFWSVLLSFAVTDGAGFLLGLSGAGSQWLGLLWPLHWLATITTTVGVFWATRSVSGDCAAPPSQALRRLVRWSAVMMMSTVILRDVIDPNRWQAVRLGLVILYHLSYIGGICWLFTYIAQLAYRFDAARLSWHARIAATVLPFVRATFVVMLDLLLNWQVLSPAGYRFALFARAIVGLAASIWALVLFRWLVSWGAHGMRGRCPACGYSLVGSTGATCPECGSSIGAALGQQHIPD